MRAYTGAETNARRDAAARDRAADNRSPAASSVTVSSMAWAFTQYEPLDTTIFITEAARRGAQLDPPMLRELYRRGLLIPFVSITYLPVAPLHQLPDPTRPGEAGQGSHS
jgi:hypothetical protein